MRLLCYESIRTRAHKKRERILLVIKVVAWTLPAFLIAQFWFFDWLSEYSENANCYNYGNISGVHLIFYGLFVFMPLFFAIIIFFLEGRRSIKVLKAGQNPLPNEKVFKPTKYRYGPATKIHPLVILSLILFMAAFSIWGGFQAYGLTQDIKPCEIVK